MKRLSGWLAAVGLIFVAVPGMADEPDPIKERLSSLVPDAENILISQTPVPGVMQVRINNDILYVSEDGRYLLQGRMIDLETQSDLTDAAKSEVRREEIQKLDERDFVSFGPDDAEFDLLVFTDPDCGYCRRLHENMAEYNKRGIRINYLGFPRAGVDSQSYEKLVSVWCAGDQQDAMNIAKAGDVPPKQTCENPVEEQYELGQALGVTGTPSMMTFDGDMIPGYVPADQLRERLEKLSANGSASD